MFDAAVAEARQPHWFVEGATPDTTEGRFAVLATVTALLIVRLEGEGQDGEAASVALTERFIEAMDAELRQMGLNDPKLGRQVRSLVGALATRVELWRGAVEDGGDWTAAIIRSLYRDQPPEAGALEHSRAALQAFWHVLQRHGLEDISQGRLG